MSHPGHRDEIFFKIMGSCVTTSGLQGAEQDQDVETLNT
jgi:hypothetical protein